jgi:hypothetical protein
MLRLTINPNLQIPEKFAPILIPCHPIPLRLSGRRVLLLTRIYQESTLRDFLGPEEIVQGARSNRRTRDPLEAVRVEEKTGIRIITIPIPPAILPAMDMHIAAAK